MSEENKVMDVETKATEDVPEITAPVKTQAKKKPVVIVAAIVVILAVVLGIVFGTRNKADKDGSAVDETETTEAVTESYPPAEKLSAFEIVFKENGNNVKRKQYLEEVKSKRYVFYLEVDEIKAEKRVWGQLYPSDAFYLDKELGAEAYRSYLNGHSPNLDGWTEEEQVAFYINFMYWHGQTSEVTFDEEIWETLEKGDKLVIEGYLTDDSELDFATWNLNVKNAVIVSKVTSEDTTVNVSSNLPD